MKKLNAGRKKLMTPLQRSYKEEADRIEDRRCVWVQDMFTGKWYHSYDKGLVRETIARLRSLAFPEKQS